MNGRGLAERPEFLNLRFSGAARIFNATQKSPIPPSSLDKPAIGTGWACAIDLAAFAGGAGIIFVAHRKTRAAVRASGQRVSAQPCMFASVDGSAIAFWNREELSPTVSANLRLGEGMVIRSQTVFGVLRQFADKFGESFG